MFRYFFIASLAVCLSACGSSPKTHFYTLNTTQQPGIHSSADEHGLRIGLWRVKLPAILDRSEIVTRSGQHSIELSDFHRWAGRLDDNISGLIASELSQRLKTDRVIVSPWPAYAKNDYQIKIAIDRFDGELGGEIVLSGAWSLLNGDGNNELARKPFALKAQTTDTSYASMVATLNALTVQLSENIAHIISSR